MEGFVLLFSAQPFVVEGECLGEGFGGWGGPQAHDEGSGSGQREGLAEAGYADSGLDLAESCFATGEDDNLSSSEVERGYFFGGEEAVADDESFRSLFLWPGEFGVFLGGDDGVALFVVQDFAPPVGTGKDEHGAEKWVRLKEGLRLSRLLEGECEVVFSALLAFFLSGQKPTVSGELKDARLRVLGEVFLCSSLALEDFDAHAKGLEFEGYPFEKVPCGRNRLPPLSVSICSMGSHDGWRLRYVILYHSFVVEDLV